jgi:hypothetical protein
MENTERRFHNKESLREELSMKTKKLAGILSAAVLASSCTSAIACQTASAKELSSASIAYDINTPAADVTGTAYAKTAEGFVQRMYNVALNRNADAAGLKNWTSQLKSGKKTAADLIDGFFFSDEYKGKKKSADEMIADCYKAMLDRSPDATGKANWKLRFDVGMSMQAICKGFVGSNEFKGLCKTYGIKPGTINLRLAKDENYERTYFVYRLYKNCLGRTPDGAGLENWCKQIKSGKTGSNLVEGFVFSDEYQNRKTSNKEFISMLYNTILGRSASTSEITSWTNKLNKGKSRQYAANGFLFSNEFKGQCQKAGINVGNKIPAPEDIPPTPTQVNGTLYKGNGIIIKYKGITSPYDGVTYINLYIENNNSRNLCVQIEDMSVNGYVIDGIFSPDIPAGKKINDEISILNSYLTKNNISKVKEIDIRFNIFDWDDYKYEIITDPVRIVADYKVTT